MASHTRRAMRAAASGCLVFAYKVGGEDAWKYIGRVGGQVRDALEEKFAKAAKEMDRKNEGRPGAWLKDGRLVGGLEGPAEWDSDEAVALIRHFLKPSA